MMYLALMSGGAITVNQMWQLPIPRREIYSKIIQNWHKNQMKMNQQFLKAGGMRCPFV